MMIKASTNSAVAKHEMEKAERCHARPSVSSSNSRPVLDQYLREATRGQLLCQRIHPSVHA